MHIIHFVECDVAVIMKKRMMVNYNSIDDLELEMAYALCDEL